MPAIPPLVSLFPNPVSQSATLLLSCSEMSTRKIFVRNEADEEVQMITQGLIPEGMHTYEIDGSNLLPGIYFITIEEENKVQQSFRFIKQ